MSKLISIRLKHVRHFKATDIDFQFVKLRSFVPNWRGRKTCTKSCVFNLFSFLIAVISNSIFFLLNFVFWEHNSRYTFDIYIFLIFLHSRSIWCYTPAPFSHYSLPTFLPPFPLSTSPSPFHPSFVFLASPPASLFFSPSPLSPSPSLSSYWIAMLGSCFVGPHTTRPPQGKIWSHFMMSYRVSVFGFWCPLAEVCFIFFYGLLSVKKCVLFSFWAICLNAVFEFEFVVW